MEFLDTANHCGQNVLRLLRPQWAGDKISLHIDNHQQGLHPCSTPLISIWFVKYRETFPDKRRAAWYQAARKGLTGTLIVGNAFRLGRTGIFRGEGQNDQGNQIRQHPIEVGADSQVRQQVNPVPVDINAGIAGRDTLKQAEQERGPSNVQRFPVAFRKVLYRLPSYLGRR